MGVIDSDYFFSIRLFGVDEHDAIASQILASLADEEAWKKRFVEKRDVIRRRLGKRLRKMLGARHCRCPNTIGWPETPCLRCALKLEYAARLRLVELLVLLRLIHHIDVDELDFRIPLAQQGFEGVFELQVVDVDSDYGTATAGRGVHLFVSPRLDIPQVKVVEILAVSGRAQDAVGAF
jgi:hypothetical protein